MGDWALITIDHTHHKGRFMKKETFVRGESPREERIVSQGALIVHKLSGEGQCDWDTMGACSLVNRVLNSKSKGLGFDSHCWSCVSVSCKRLISYCLCPPITDGYLVDCKKKHTKIVMIDYSCAQEMH